MPLKKYCHRRRSRVASLLMSVWLCVSLGNIKGPYANEGL